MNKCNIEYAQMKSFYCVHTVVPYKIVEQEDDILAILCLNNDKQIVLQ